MEDGFELPVLYREQERWFPARLVSFGWTHQIQVQAEGLTICFEKDEERQWRAIIRPEQEGWDKKIDSHLLRAITDAIEKVLQ